MTRVSDIRIPHARGPQLSRRMTLLVCIAACSLVTASPVAIADVGDQYLPDVPDSGAERGDGAAGTANPSSGGPGSGQSADGRGSSKKQDGDDTPSALGVPGTPGGDDSGPGTAAVVGLSLLALAAVGLVLWLVIRGRGTDGGTGDGTGRPIHRTSTPPGEIVDDSSGRSAE